MEERKEEEDKDSHFLFKKKYGCVKLAFGDLLLVILVRTS